MHAEKSTAFRVENLVTLIAVAIPAGWLGLIVQAYMDRSAEKQEVARGISNCRQIITALRQHSADHGGQYIDPRESTEGDEKGPRTANEKFRILFTDRVLDKEHIFGCPNSPYVPDGKIGTAPNFDEALRAGENHWMMTLGLSDSASGNVPLVYENAAVAKWDPKWNADAKRKAMPGRTWTKGIIIGMNDSSVTLQKLATTAGKEVPLQAFPGANVNHFTEYGDDFKVLDIER